MRQSRHTLETLSEAIGGEEVTYAHYLKIERYKNQEALKTLEKTAFSRLL
jgi:hypothetical protein